MRAIGIEPTPAAGIQPATMLPLTSSPHIKPVDATPFSAQCAQPAPRVPEWSYVSHSQATFPPNECYRAPIDLVHRLRLTFGKGVINLFWYRQRDSNPHFNDPKSFASANWAISAYKNNLWWKIWESNPSDFLGANEMTTPCSPIPHIGDLAGN